MIVSDLFDGIIAKMGNRTDLAKRIPIWARKAILELTQTYEFEELKVTGPLTTFTANQAEYSKNFFTINNEDWTDIKSWFLQLPTTTVGWEIKGRSLMMVEPLSKISGIPTFWAQHGSLLIIGFNPNQAYTTQVRYQRKHPFTPQDQRNISVNSYDNNEIYMPEEWQDVIEFAAAIRGATEERQFDYVNGYRDIVYGDEKYRLSDGQEGNPGLIFGLTSQQYRNKQHNERQLQPIVQRYQL